MNDLNLNVWDGGLDNLGRVMALQPLSQLPSAHIIGMHEEVTTMATCHDLVVNCDVFQFFCGC